MNDIYEFLEKWIADNGIIKAGDEKTLANFMREFGAKIDELSIVPSNSGNKLILYSGQIGDVFMWRVAQGASQSELKYYYISDTEAGKMILDPYVSEKLNQICNHDENLYNRIMGNPIDGQVRSSYVVDDQLSVNDRISNRIAQNASGDVNIWAPYGATNTVLTDTELRAVLTNEKITSINGVPKGTFINEYLRYANIDNFPFDAPESLNTKALYSVFDSIKDSVAEDFFDKVQIYYNNLGKVIFVDTTPMLGGTFNMSEDINYSFSTTIGDRRQYASADYLASICSEYNILTDLQKLQIGQLELNGRNHNFTDMHMLFQGSSTGSTGNVRIAFDINGNVMAIDASALTSGRAMNLSSSSAVFDIASDGSISVRLQNAPDGSAWWHNHTMSILDDVRVTSINGVPAEQFRNLRNNLDAIGDQDVLGIVNRAISDVPSSNTGTHTLLSNATSGKTQLFSGLVPNTPRAMKVAAALGALGLLGDGLEVVDLITTLKIAHVQYEEGDMEGVSDTLGEYVMSNVGATIIGGGVAGFCFGLLVQMGVISLPLGWVAIFAYCVLGSDMGLTLWDQFLDPLNDEYTRAGNAHPPVDPLAIDLGALGIDLTSLENGVHFDLDKNGFAEKTAWIGIEDGFLVLDRNGDGTINDGGELFGDKVELQNGLTSVSGFEALAELDNNNDGCIDAEDSAWTSLRVWIDSNHDGISQGELKTLDDLGIVSISLEVTKEENVDTATGTMEAEYAMVTFKDGTERKISEFWFPVNVSDTTQGTEDGDIVETVGNVPDIYVAMEEDGTGTLRNLYEQFQQSKDYVEKRVLLKKILYFVTDSTNIHPKERGGNIDARDLNVIESFMGREFVGVGGSNPNSNAATILKNIYITIENVYFNILNADTVDGMYTSAIMEFQNENGETVLELSNMEFLLKTLIEGGENVDSIVYSIASYLSYYDKAHNSNEYTKFNAYCCELSPAYAEIIAYAKSGNTYLGTGEYDYFYGSDASDFAFGNEGGDTLCGRNGNDILYGGDGNDSILGDAGDDKLYGEGGNDSLNGGAGSDQLWGGSDNDTLDGKSGDDVLYGGTGDDVYVFGRGYGVDIIDDAEGAHTIRFDHLNPGDILVNGTGENDVTITIKGTSDKLTIKNFCMGEEYSDYMLVFDSVKMHVTDHNSPFRHIYGSAGNDTLKAVLKDSIMHAFDGDDMILGSEGNDIIYGNSGSDEIVAGNGTDYVYGGAGNDVIDAKEGNDFIYGDVGADTYVFGRGYGIDIINDNSDISTIVLTENLALDDIQINSVGENIVICITDTEDKLILNGAAKNQDLYKLVISGEEVSIAENIVESELFISGEDNYDYIVNSDKSIIAGGANGDRIIGSEAGEYVLGDSGNDQILTYSGNDVISGGEGDDYINAGAESDVIDGACGRDFMDGGMGDDTYIFQPGYGNDFIMDSEGLNTIFFGDGFTATGIKAYRSNWNDLLIRFEGFEDTLTIKNYCINEDARNFNLVFADGTVVGATEKDSPLRTIYGTDGSEYMISIYSDGITKIGQDGNDQLVGSNGSDYLCGNSGDDRLTASSGNDVLDGGVDNDYLYGETGNDTYIFKKGYGIDTIGDSAGMNVIEIYGYSSSDIKAYRTNWNDITITFKDSEDKLVIEGFFISENNRNFDLIFNGGYKVRATASNSPLRTIYGTDNGDYILAMDDKGVTLHGDNGSDSLNGGAGEDKLYGGNGDDQLYGNAGRDILAGGQGNDYLYGGSGEDIYIFEKGAGIDTIQDISGVNVIRFGTGLHETNLKAYRTNWNDLTITFDGIEDKLVVQGYFTSSDNRNFNVEFANGSKYAYDDVNNPIKEVYANEYNDWMSAWSDEGIILHGAGGDDTLNGGTGADALYGDAGNDMLYGNDGSDVLDGGAGSDTLNGGIGEDTYVFKTGYGVDMITDCEGINNVFMTDIKVESVVFNMQNDTELSISIQDSQDTLLIKEFSTESYVFHFAEDVVGSVDSVTSEFVKYEEEETDKQIDIMDETTIQSNVNVLSELYMADDFVQNEFINETSDKLITESATAVLVEQEEEGIDTQTNIQVMLLVDNMSAFSEERNVSEGVEVSTTESNILAVDQILINSQI